MKLATTPEEQRRWMAQWRSAAVVLAEAEGLAAHARSIALRLD